MEKGVYACLARELKGVAIARAGAQLFGWVVGLENGVDAI